MNKEQYNYLFNKVTTFKDMEDYLNHMVYETLEDFQMMEEQGDYQRITRGVYNGALDKFTPNTINAEELAGALKQYLQDDYWLDYLYMEYEEADDLETYEKLTWFDVLEDYLNTQDVFTIGNEIYVNVS